jgi:hypothetical protein
MYKRWRNEFNLYLNRMKQTQVVYFLSQHCCLLLFWLFFPLNWIQGYALFHVFPDPWFISVIMINDSFYFSNNIFCWFQVDVLNWRWKYVVNTPSVLVVGTAFNESWLRLDESAYKILLLPNSHLELYIFLNYPISCT